MTIRRGLAWLLPVVGLYAASLLLATYPAALNCGSRLAVGDVADPLQHLWQMRWARDRLLAGDSPFFCPSIQWPTGSPLGLYSPLQLQTATYIILRIFTGNDVLIYNLILFFQLLFTGLGTFALAFDLSRSRAGATLAGLLAMLGAPMLSNALMGGTELLAIGCFPLFLMAWMRFLDAPSPRRLLGAVGLFALAAISAPYYGIIAVVPATIHVVAAAFAGGRAGFRGWFQARFRWLMAFAALSAIAIPPLFPAQIWAVLHGVAMGRSRAQFEQFGTTAWEYLVPGPPHFLARQVMPKFSDAPGFLDRPTVYLGVVTLLLTLYAAIKPVRLRHGATLWLSIACLFVLSLGASTTVGDRRIPLPASWLWDHLPPFRMLRVPVRFGYFAMVCAAIVAGAAAGQILDGYRTWFGRRLMLAFLAVLAVADLAIVPFPTAEFRPLPDCYASILKSRPSATFCEVHSTAPHLSFEGQLTYWQALHLGRTSAGNPGVVNNKLDHAAALASPFHYTLLGDPGYLESPGPINLGLVANSDFLDYTWVWLTANRFDHLVLHRWTLDGSPPPPSIFRVGERLAHATTYEDTSTSVYDLARVRKPTRPTAVCTTGWLDRLPFRDSIAANATKDARLAVFNPDGDRPLALRIRASSHLRPRTVRVLADGREVAIWRIEPGEIRTFACSGFCLPAGLNTLSIASEDESRPLRLKGLATEASAAPFSLRVAEIELSQDASQTAGASADPVRR